MSVNNVRSTSNPRGRAAQAALCLSAWAALALAAPGAQAADWYVRPNGSNYGAGNGKTWTDAFAGFSAVPWSAVACGDTVWLAGGTYTQQLGVSKSCTAGSPLAIRRVRSTDSVPANAAGWNASFDSTVVVSNANPGISVPSGAAITIDGRIDYGIKVVIPAGGGDGAKVATAGNVDRLTLAHVEIAGPTCAPAGNCKTAAYGLNFAPSSNKITNLLVSHGAVHSISEAMRACNWDTAVIEFSDLYDIVNDGVDHEDTMYSYPSSNVTMRYNFIHNVPNDGIFFEYGGATNFRLYGNVFYASHLSLLTAKSPGAYGPMLIYNNVFAAPSPNDYGWLHANGVVTKSGTELANNVFFNVSHDFPNAHNNAYNYTTLNGYGWPSNEPGSFTFTGSGGTTNVNGGDAHISSSSVLRNRGASLAQDGFIDHDMDGNVRGADGSWDIGAFEYVDLDPPAPPKNVKVN